MAGVCVIAERRVRRAFTLLEVLLVLVILVVIAGLLWPSVIERREIAQVDYAASRLAALVTMVRSTAMSTGRRHRVVFGEAGSLVWVESEDDPFESPGVFTKVAADWTRLDLGEFRVHCAMVDLAGYSRLLNDREQSHLQEKLPDELMQPLEFTPDGRGPRALVVLVGETRERVALELNSLTGQAKVLKDWGVPEEQEE